MHPIQLPYIPENGPAEENTLNYGDAAIYTAAWLLLSSLLCALQLSAESFPKLLTPREGAYYPELSARGIRGQETRGLLSTCAG